MAAGSRSRGFHAFVIPRCWRSRADLLSAGPVIGPRPALAFLAASLVCATPASAGDDAFEGMAGPYGERLRYDEKGLTAHVSRSRR